MILDSYSMPQPPVEVDPDDISLHVVKVSPKDFIEIALNDRRYLIKKKDTSFKIGDLVHLKPIDEQSIEPSLFHRILRFFRGDGFAFKIYSQENLYVITCEDHFEDSDYQVIGLRSLRQ